MVKLSLVRVTGLERLKWPGGRSRSRSKRWSIGMWKRCRVGHCRMKGLTVRLPRPPAWPEAGGDDVGGGDDDLGTVPGSEEEGFGGDPGEVEEAGETVDAAGVGDGGAGSVDDAGIADPPSAISSRTKPGRAGASRKLVSPRLRAGSATWVSGRRGCVRGVALRPGAQREGERREPQGWGAMGHTRVPRRI